MKILVTGSSGFLGKVLCDDLQAEGHEVWGLSRSLSLGQNISCDLATETPPIENHRFDVIVHAAGRAHLSTQTEAEKQATFAANVTGTENLLKALTHKPQAFIFISTVAVYGLSSGQNITEEQPLRAEDPYGQSKIIAENLVLDWGQKHSVKTSILRLPLIAGPEPKGNLKAMMMGIKKGYYFRIGAGHTRRSMVLAEDIAQNLLTIAQTGGVYHLTDGSHPSFQEIEEAICLRFHKKRILSLPLWWVQIVARVGDALQAVGLGFFPLNSSKLDKMTSTLTFSDQKARQSWGWQPNSVVAYLKNI